MSRTKKSNSDNVIAKAQRAAIKKVYVPKSARGKYVVEADNGKIRVTVTK